MTEVFSGSATDAQIAALLVALHMKGETVEEIVGFAEAIRAPPPPLPIHLNAALTVTGIGPHPRRPDRSADIPDRRSARDSSSTACCCCRGESARAWGH